MDIHNCPACEDDRYAHYPHPMYHRCCKCDSLYQYTGIEQIADCYDGPNLDFSNQTGSYRIYLRIMKKFIKLEAYNLIDIGAGDGVFLDLAKPFVQQVMGYDASPVANACLAKKGYLTDRHLATVSPKIVTALQVIEHVQYPRIFINKLHIEETDWLVITSPAPDALTAQRLHSTGRWRSLSPSHHLCLYSRRGLDKLAADCNLILVHFEYTWSACHGFFDNIYKNILRYLKWPIKKMIGRKDPFPEFYGKNSFIAILKNTNLP